MDRERHYVYVLYLENYSESGIYGIFNNIDKLHYHYNELLQYYEKQKHRPIIAILKLPIDVFLGEKFIINGEDLGYLSAADNYQLTREEITKLFKTCIKY